MSANPNKWRGMTPIERLLSRGVRSDTGCLEYAGYLNKWGYGRLRAEGRKVLAHRFVFEATHGKLPREILVCHRCDNPKCIEIAHLFAGTAKDNHADMMAKGRKAWATGERHYQAKLTWEAVRDVRAGRRDPHSIAKEFGVCMATVNYAKSGVTWRA